MVFSLIFRGRLIVALTTVQSIVPALGGNDTINGGDDDDILIGGAADDTINGDNGSDVIFGDHGQVDTTQPATTNFVSIFTQATDGGGNDTIHGGAGDDFILGQQGGDLLYGDGGDDDVWGGHNVAGGVDGSDRMDGGAGNDVMLGDTLSPTQFR